MARYTWGGRRLPDTLGGAARRGLGFDLPKQPPGARKLPGKDGIYIDPVVITASRPKIEVIGRLIGKPTAAPPKPQYETVRLPGRTAAVRYIGHDPHEQQIPMMLDKGGAAGVEQLVTRLEDLLERHEAGGEPPVVKVAGDGIPHTGLQWRVQDIEENEELTRYLNDGRRERFAFTLHLLEHVVDRQLARSITGEKGVRANRKVTARKGESLYDVARRVYGDPSRASDLQRMNPAYTYGTVFKHPTKLRAV